MNKKFSRKKDHRKMMLRNLVTSLMLYEKVQTTKTKALVLKELADKTINIGREGGLTARRKLLAYLLDKNAVKKIFEVLIPRYHSRNSGYTVIYKIGTRLGDGSSKVLVQLVPEEKPKMRAKQINKDQVTNLKVVKKASTIKKTKQSSKNYIKQAIK